jgi:hypothetical protein
VNISEAPDLESVKPGLHQENEHVIEEAVLGLVSNQAEAAALVKDLQVAGFFSNDISALFPDRSGTRDFAHEQHTLVVGTKKKNKSKGNAASPERKVASWVSERTVAIQDATDSKVDPLDEALRDTVKTTARAGAPPPDHEHAAVAGTEVATPTRTPGAGVGGGYRFG